MLQRIIIDGTQYYQWVINNEVGDLFTDWRDIQYYKAKLINIQAK